MSSKVPGTFDTLDTFDRLDRASVGAGGTVVAQGRMSPPGLRRSLAAALLPGLVPALCSPRAALDGGAPREPGALAIRARTLPKRCSAKGGNNPGAP